MRKEFNFLEKEKLRIRFIELLVLSASVLTAISDNIGETIGTLFLTFMVGVVLYYMVIFHESSKESLSIFAAVLIAFGFAGVFVSTINNVSSLNIFTIIGYFVLLPMLILLILLHEEYIQKLSRN